MIGDKNILLTFGFLYILGFVRAVFSLDLCKIWKKKLKLMGFGRKKPRGGPPRLLKNQARSPVISLNIYRAFHNTSALKQ